MIALTSALTLALAAISASAAPTKRNNSQNSPLPLADGFPTPSPDQLKTIQVTAHGTLSNGSRPASVSADSLTSLRLVNLAESIEAVFFQQFLWNVTNRVPGYEVPAHIDYDYMVDFLTVTKADEELHSLNAGNSLKAFGQPTITPCSVYHFPVQSFSEAVTLATTFTSNVFGVLGDIADGFARNGDVALVRAIVQTAAQEGEQNGFYRYLLGKVPDQLPFTTVSTRDFAFTAIQNFVDPSSCPDLDKIALKTFGKIAVLDKPGPATQTIRFGVDASKHVSGRSYNVVYINQLNVPVVLPTTVDYNTSDQVILSAVFPYDEHLLNGLTIAVITDQAGPFANVGAVRDAAIFAPGFIIVN